AGGNSTCSPQPANLWSRSRLRWCAMMKKSPTCCARLAIDCRAGDIIKFDLITPGHRRREIIFLSTCAMADNRKTNTDLPEENLRLRAQIAQLQDRLDHVAEHGAVAKALQKAEALHRDVMSVVSDAVLIADEAGRLTYVSPNAHFIFG